MPDQHQHRALTALVKSASDHVARAADALVKASQQLTTIAHLIDQENWWHEDQVQRPAMYSYGPIEGTKKDLAAWIFPDLKDPRCLETANRTPGIIWVVKIPQNRPENRFQVWFTSKSIFNDAQGKKLLDLKARK